MRGRRRRRRIVIDGFAHTCRSIFVVAFVGYAKHAQCARRFKRKRPERPRNGCEFNLT